MYELQERETYSKPYDIKCGYAISSSKGKHIVFPTEREAWSYIEEKQRESEVKYG